jgi:hypothetical protein
VIDAKVVNNWERAKKKEKKIVPCHIPCHIIYMEFLFCEIFPHFLTLLVLSPVYIGVLGSKKMVRK